MQSSTVRASLRPTCLPLNATRLPRTKSVGRVGRNQYFLYAKRQSARVRPSDAISSPCAPPLIAQSGTHLAIILELRLPPLDHVGGDVVPGQHGPSAADSGANHLAFVLWRAGVTHCGPKGVSFRNKSDFAEMAAMTSPKRQADVLVGLRGLQGGRQGGRAAGGVGTKEQIK